MEGHGLESRRWDPTVVTAWAFTLLGFIPTGTWAGAFGYGYFGPIAWPAILAMVGVLFAVIALLRSIDLEDLRLRKLALAALVIGMLRLFLAPLLA